ncbi:acyl-CoA dehydrogenase [Idiomarina sp. OT37-5b]|uniref:acyl-CoA dehydrogenase family protein n=1 Tax=Idiomarina sp. OT37-5b TaxID=2100422 RepID=UPI000CF86AB4|nr:acyl-CoA dehydrogenase family protein [Idiomarina sp. OT37-5b]AVJ56164.1 acyl-CoA dehydrogenase [Idiomarina sp. OT37-5b]
MDFSYSQKTKDYLQRLDRFMREFVEPYESQYQKENYRLNASSNWRDWQVPPRVEELKQMAREQGLWNLFLPDEKLGAGLSTLEYAPLAERMGGSLLAPEIFNCNAPDTGNMEVLYHFGNKAQQKRWLQPLLDGEIRSVFCMTEPDVASSDATNMQTTIVADGDEWVINGRKWWSTGLGHPNAEIAIVMGLTDEEADKHQRHSMILVPLNSSGVTIERMLPALGEYDAPYGHGEVVFDQVRVPKDNIIVGPGAGFKIAQGRLGPGRIHHCMRALGAAERALQLFIERGVSRIAFGQPLLKLGGNTERLADLRVAIDQARLMTLYAAWQIDNIGALKAIKEISAIKLIAPSVLQKVVDETMQLYGGASMCHDTPLPGLLAVAKSLRIADGPDAVHRATIAKAELKQWQGRQHDS